MIQTNLYTALAADSLLSAKIEDRVYAVVAPQKPICPYIVYLRVSKKDTADINGVSSLDAGRFQIDVWAKTYKESVETAKLVETALSGKAELINQMDDYDGEVKLYRQICEYLIFEDKI